MDLEWILMKSKESGFVGLLSAALIVLLAGMAAAGTFSPALVGDTYMDAEVEDEPFADEEILWVASEDGAPVRITFLTFREMIMLSEQIESGELQMYVSEVDSPGEVSLHFYDMAVLETETWADLPSYDEETLATIEIEEEGWAAWDATSLVKKAATECSEGCPFTVVLVAEGDSSIGFRSMEGSEDEMAVLEYTA
jgi:hypothetical protein